MENCTDDGQKNDRNNSEILGCPTHGIVSRFPILGSNHSLLGPEEIILNNTNICTQFGTGGIADILLSPDQRQLYVSVGAGGNANMDAIPDIGQYGNDPCGNGNPWGGHLRAQDPLSYDGSILRINISDTVPLLTPVTKIDLVAKGFFNPWRMVWKSTSINTVPELYVIDTGLLDYEELNGPIINVYSNTSNNYGFPCTQGNVSIPPFNAPFLNPAPPMCTAMLVNSSLYTPPMWYSYHPNTPSVFSAVVYNSYTNRWYIGDMMEMIIFSIPGNASYKNFNPADKRIEAIGIFPVHLDYVPNTTTLLMMDVLQGELLSSDLWPLPPVSSPSPAPNNNPTNGNTDSRFSKLDETMVSYVLLGATFCTLLSTMTLPSLFMW